jgi:hypothetical protein
LAGEDADHGHRPLASAVALLAGGLAFTSFLVMWISWIRHMGVLGLVLGWFFGLQAACLVFVIAAAALGAAALVLGALLEAVFWALRPKADPS